MSQRRKSSCEFCVYLQIECPQFPEELKHWISFISASSQALRAESGLEDKNKWRQIRYISIMWSGVGLRGISQHCTHSNIATPFREFSSTTNIQCIPIWGQSFTLFPNCFCLFDVKKKYIFTAAEDKKTWTGWEVVYFKRTWIQSKALSLWFTKYLTVSWLVSDLFVLIWKHNRISDLHVAQTLVFHRHKCMF